MTHPHIKLIKAHTDCQSGMYLNGTYRDTQWFGGFSEVVSDFFWNFVSPLELPNGDDEQVYSFFERLDRTPALYGESSFIDDTADALGLNGCDVGYKDQWMEYSGPRPDVGDVDFRIKDVRNDAAGDDFLEVFKVAYGDASAEDPYGGLPPTYIEALEDGFVTRLGDYDTHLVAYEDEGPVAIGSIIQSGNIAIIYNMGTVPDRQGEGIGTQIAKQLIVDMLDAGVDHILLQTEPGSYVEKFYAGMGFNPKFEAKALIGGSWEPRFSGE